MSQAFHEAELSARERSLDVIGKRESVDAGKRSSAGNRTVADLPVVVEAARMSFLRRVAQKAGKFE
jgi:hypothetical protein